MQRHQPHAFGQIGIGRRRHAAFSGRDRLVGVEREAADGRGVLTAALPGRWAGTAATPRERRAPRLRPPTGRSRAANVSKRVMSSISPRDVDGKDADDARVPRESRNARPRSASSLRRASRRSMLQRDRIAIDENRKGPADSGRSRRSPRRSSSAPAPPVPAFRPRASTARCRAAVQEFTATAYGAPTAAAKSSSNCLTRGPVVNQPDLRAATTSPISASETSGRKKGTFTCVMALSPVVSMFGGLSVQDLEAGSGSQRRRGRPPTAGTLVAPGPWPRVQGPGTGPFPCPFLALPTNGFCTSSSLESAKNSRDSL